MGGGFLGGGFLRGGGLRSGAGGDWLRGVGLMMDGRGAGNGRRVGGLKVSAGEARG